MNFGRNSGLAIPRSDYREERVSSTDPQDAVKPTDEVFFDSDEDRRKLMEDMDIHIIKDGLLDYFPPDVIRENLDRHYWKCWKWHGERDRYGYGRIKEGHYWLLAHRVAWGLQNGRIPAGGMIRHLCGQGHEGCVRPAHLVIGTHAQNMYDRLLVGHKGLTVADIVKIRRGNSRLYYRSRGFSSQRIANIVNRHTYNFVGEKGEFCGEEFDLSRLDPKPLPEWEDTTFVSPSLL